MGGDRRQRYGDRGRDNHGNDEGKACHAFFFRSHQGYLILLGPHIDGGLMLFIVTFRPYGDPPARVPDRKGVIRGRRPFTSSQGSALTRAWLDRAKAAAGSQAAIAAEMIVDDDAGDGTPASRVRIVLLYSEHMLSGQVPMHVDVCACVEPPTQVPDRDGVMCG